MSTSVYGLWVPDPTGRHELRFWDGDRWTPQVCDDGSMGIDPLLQPPAPRRSPETPRPTAPPSPAVARALELPDSRSLGRALVVVEPRSPWAIIAPLIVIMIMLITMLAFVRATHHSAQRLGTPSQPVAESAIGVSVAH